MFFTIICKKTRGFCPFYLIIQLPKSSKQIFTLKTAASWPRISHKSYRLQTHKTALLGHCLLTTRFSTPCCGLSASFRADNYVQSHSGQFVTRAEKKTSTGTRKKHVLWLFSSTTKEICLKCVKLHLAYLTMKNILSRLPFNFTVPLKDNEIWYFNCCRLESYANIPPCQDNERKSDEDESTKNVNKFLGSGLFVVERERRLRKEIRELASPFGCQIAFVMLNPSRRLCHPIHLWLTFVSELRKHSNAFESTACNGNSFEVTWQIFSVLGASLDASPYAGAGKHENSSRKGVLWSHCVSADSRAA